MATDKEFVTYVLDQVGGGGEVTAKAMFGEYALYARGRVIALICDNQLFVKITPGGKEFAVDAPEGPPYPGAKPCLQVTDRLEDHDWIHELIRITTRELPMPKSKKSSPKKSSKSALKKKASAKTGRGKKVTAAKRNAGKKKSAGKQKPEAAKKSR